MVKGVNKTIIEVMNTESKYFERILFVVSPEALGLGEKRLQKEAENTVAQLDISGGSSISLRQLQKNRKNRLIKTILLLSAAIIAVLIAVGLMI